MAKRAHRSENRRTVLILIAFAVGSIALFAWLLSMPYGVLVLPFLVGIVGTAVASIASGYKKEIADGGQKGQRESAVRGRESDACDPSEDRHEYRKSHDVSEAEDVVASRGRNATSDSDNEEERVKTERAMEAALDEVMRRAIAARENRGNAVPDVPDSHMTATAGTGDASTVVQGCASEHGHKMTSDDLARARRAHPFLAKDVSNLDPRSFELWICDLLRGLGYDGVRHVGGVGDFGLDVVASRGGVRYGFQCKFYSGPVGQEAVREAASGIAHYNCDVAITVTNSTFTRAAMTLARDNNVELWDGNDLKRLRKEVALRAVSHDFGGRPGNGASSDDADSLTVVRDGIYGVGTDIPAGEYLLSFDGSIRNGSSWHDYKSYGIATVYTSSSVDASGVDKYVYEGEYPYLTVTYGRYLKLKAVIAVLVDP